MPALIGHVEVEALFRDGSRLLVIPQPVGPADPDGPGAVTAAPIDAAAAPVTAITVVNRAAVPIAFSVAPFGFRVSFATNCPVVFPCTPITFPFTLAGHANFPGFPSS